MKIFYRRSFILLSILLTCWLIMAQSCMKMRISDDKAQEQFKASGISLTTAYYDIDGYKLHYASTGNDSFPTIIFIHGSPGSWNAFETYMRDSSMLSRYRMFSVDRPGFGYSNFGEDKDMQEQTDIIVPWIKSIDNKKPLYLVGHSLGGPMVVKIAGDNPEMCKGIVLLAASLDPDEEPKEIWRGLLYYTPLQYLMPGAFRPSNNEIWSFKSDLDGLKKEVQNIKCDVYVVHGDADTFVPVGNANYARKNMVNAGSITVKILKDAPHFIPWEPWYKDVRETLLKMK